MKTRFLIIIGILITIFSISTGFVLNENVNLTRQIQETNSDNQKLESILRNYTDTFGNVSFDQDIPKSAWKIESKVFVTSALDELTPVSMVKVAESYSITATITRPSGIADYPPLLGYVMYIEVQDQNENRIVGSWHQDTIRVNQTTSGGTYWSPKNIGNYTIEVFVWSSFGGTPLAELTTINVDVKE